MPRWAPVWVHFVALQRELVHEHAQAAASIVDTATREHNDTMTLHFGRDDGIERALTTLSREYAGFVRALATESVDAGSRLLEYQRAGHQLADSLAEFARRARRKNDVTADDVYSSVIEPLVALSLESARAYHAKRYAESLDAHTRALVHATDVLGPYCDVLATPGTTTKLAVMQLLRAVPT